MDQTTGNIIVFVDTSYLTHMPPDEKADWGRLLQHAKACRSDLNVKPRMEIHISEIVLREYSTKLVDDLRHKVSQAKREIDSLLKNWNTNEIASKLDYPFPINEDAYLTEEEIYSAANQVIKDMLDSGVREIQCQNHHQSNVWNNYFSWKPPFDIPSISERVEKKSREKRRIHIPDAWILEAAIDLKNEGHSMLCLCKDKNLSRALKSYGHKVHERSSDILNIIFPSATMEPALENSTDGSDDSDNRSLLDNFLSKSVNENIKGIYLRLLGFVDALGTPSHEVLINTVASKGFDHKLIAACAVMLSDESNPYIKDTGSHYVVGNKEICEDAANRVTSEIIEMLEQV